ncbi:MAG: VCBS repeat-containing protein [Planctomycetes bacterium]|nr:VCBS repeat-containing protein [Planctomycetota bacterium]
MITALAAAAAVVLPQDPVPTVIQLPPQVRVTGILCPDVDGDGRHDLVVAGRDTTGQRRELRLHRRRADGPPFDNTPSLPPHPIEADVVAFAFADVLPEPGRELVLLTPERAVAVERDADGAPTYRPLFAPRLLWPAASPQFVVPLGAALVDPAGDGRDALLLPQPDGALLWRGDGTAPFELRLPARRTALAARAKGGPGGGVMATAGDGLQLRFALGDDDDDSTRGPLLRLRTAAPPCQLVDLDGDGRLDLAAVRNGQLHAALQRDGGAFQACTFDLPLPEDRLALFDPAFDVQCVDLDGDRRADLVVTTSARRGDEVEVRVDVFSADPNGGWRTPANGRLRVQPLARPPQLVDADGDGRPDLVLVTVRTDALRTLTGEAPKALEAQLLVFRGDGARFAAPAMLQQTLRLPTGEGGATPFVHVLPGRDGLAGELLLREDQDLQRRPLQPRGDRLLLLPSAAACRLPQGARLEGPFAAGGEVFAWTDHEVLFVRLR